jgi:outer membrane protein assembly factor BamA
MNRQICFFLFILILVSFSLSAQNKDGTVILPDTLDYPYIHIAGIEITGNKLTKEKIITRELNFKVGDSLSTFESGKNNWFSEKRFAPADSSQLKLFMTYSRENLINTKLFLTVNLSLIQLRDNHYNLIIDVTERHYWWIFPVVKLNAPNFNEWLRDIDWTALSMGLFFSHNNLFGTSHQTSIVGYVGKSYAAAWGYKIPWIGKGQKIGLTFGAAYQNLYTVEYGSLENKRQMLYDYNSLQNVKLTAMLNLRPGLYNYGTVKLSGEWIKASDSLYQLDTNYLGGQKKTNLSLSLYADYYYDSRNSHSYPLKGSMLKVFVNKVGLGIVSKDVDIFYYGVDLHFYQAIGRKFYVAEMVKAEGASGQNYPYYYQLNMGYKKDFIRGYDLYTLKGDQMYYFRSNFKYELINPSLKKVKSGQEKNKFKALQYAFYLNAFADCGYVVDKFTENNPYNNKMLFSWGLGLDFVTYYDMVLRFEYAFTSIWTNGFFIGFGMPI